MTSSRAMFALLLGSVAGCHESPLDTPDASAPAGTVGEQDGDWSWTNPIPKADSLFGVAFHDGQLGVAAGIRNLLRTTDGGRTWTPVPSALDMIEAVRFTAESRLVAVGFNYRSVSPPAT